MNTKHKSIVAGLDQGEVEKQVGQEKDTAGHVKVITEGWFLFQDFFSYGENEKKVQKQRGESQKCDLIQPEEETV
jgi:hypothetical protein